MALQSQMARGGIGSRVSESGRSARDPQRKIIGYSLLGALVIAGGYWYFNAKPRPTSADTPGPLAQTPAPAPNVSAAPAAQPARTPDPTVFDMWSGRSKGTPTTAQAQPTTSPTPTAPAASKPPAPTPSGPAVRDPLTDAAPGSTPSPTSSAPTAPPPPLNSSTLAPEIAALIQAGDRAQREGRLIDARKQLNSALFSTTTTPSDRAAIRAKIADINQTLVFSPSLSPGDPISDSYVVEKGDSLVRIARKKGTVTEPNLIARINKLANANAVRVGQSLKIVRGPFHAVVSKSAFRMDVYQGPTPATGSIGASNLPDSIEPGWTYICSFPVGLGEKGITPIANFYVKENSKLTNPFWVNPRTGEKFAADDPKNPIGERWIGLEGVNAKDRAFTGYGVHGTIDESSIGRELSMGCVRMHAPDVELVYDLLTPRVSVVKIVE